MNRRIASASTTPSARSVARIATCLGGALLPILALAAGCGSPPEEAQASTESAAAAGMRFGVAPQWYQGYTPPSEGPANVDAVVVGDWLVENGFTDAHQKKIDQILRAKKTPYFFGYIATSLTKKGLGQNNDCDGNPAAKLCQEGAQYIRTHLDSEIVPAYRAAAQRIGQSVAGHEALIHIEPDWYQFSENAQQNAFTRDESNGAMNKILGAIRAGCSSCSVVIDFSPWFSADRTKWASSASDFYAGWDRSTVKYVGLTGKPFPFTEGKIDNYTYRQISSELKLPLVIVDGYTFGGGPIDIDRTWLDRQNLAKASSMGVSMVFLSQQGDVAGYDKFLGDLRGSAPPPPPPQTPAPGPAPKPAPAPTPAPKPAPTPPPAPPSSDGAGGVSVAGGDLTADVATKSTWDSGYCKEVSVTAKSGQGVVWTARVPKQGSLSQSWSSVVRNEGGSLVFTGVDYNRELSAGQTATFGYCVNL